MNLIQAYDSGSGTSSDSDSHVVPEASPKKENVVATKLEEGVGKKPVDGLTRLLAKRRRAEEIKQDDDSDASSDAYDIMALARRDYMQESLKRARVETQNDEARPQNCVLAVPSAKKETVELDPLARGLFDRLPVPSVNLRTQKN